MIDKFFVDTNLLVYARDSSHQEKLLKANIWMDHLWKNKLGRISIQVLNEFYVTVTKKIKPGMSKKTARADIADLLSWNPVPLDTKVLNSALKIEEINQFSFWDSLIIGAALVSDCKYLLTEDMQHEQKIEGLIVLNPFEVSPKEISQ